MNTSGNDTERDSAYIFHIDGEFEISSLKIPEVVNEPVTNYLQIVRN